ncbi:putative ATP-dependent RNA helicase ddx47 [Plutella xylostella]|uniref:RNA helicase n=1 Tax=Plutella xylostella TaxID=51655 RepID=A0ABQ7QTM1_PLUXY|nr:putative ATP-dependent RNA helicase ddx47 [Plutella xylostella]
MTEDKQSTEEESQSSEEDEKTEEAVEAEPEKQDEEEETVTFKDLGIVDVLCEACQELKWKNPSKIQKESIPVALQGKDIIGLAETGSGKTGAFALPILQALLESPQRYFALILTPTRELAFQISEQFEALGASIGVKCAVIVGGMDMVAQSLVLAKKPHIIIATPGRLVDHLENTKGFNLKALKYLVMDEADRILNMDFEVEVDKILRVIPRERRTYLFSATMTKKVQKLQRASLRDPVKVEVSTKYQTVEKLQQCYLFIPVKYKDVYLVHILNEMSGSSFIVFVSTCAGALRCALLLRHLGLAAVPLHGQMSQNKRLAALNKFKSKGRSVLICTDVASRGLDIPHVDVVINLDIPLHSKDYIHRVGRTARAGRAGKAITFVSQYDVELYQRIEQLIGKQLPLYKTDESEVMVLQERVSEAQRLTKIEMKELEDKKNFKGKKRGAGGADSEDDTEEAAGVRRRIKGKGGRGGKQHNHGGKRKKR